jgi:hypothetical protein
LRLRFGGMFAPCSLLSSKLPDPVGLVPTICEQHRFWKQGAEENRTQPIVVHLTGRESEMDRQAIGVHHRVNLSDLVQLAVNQNNKY